MCYSGSQINSCSTVMVGCFAVEFKIYHRWEELQSGLLQISKITNSGVVQFDSTDYKEKV